MSDADADADADPKWLLSKHLVDLMRGVGEMDDRSWMRDFLGELRDTTTGVQLLILDLDLLPRRCKYTYHQHDVNGSRQDLIKSRRIGRGCIIMATRQVKRRVELRPVPAMRQVRRQPIRRQSLMYRPGPWPLDHRNNHFASDHRPPHLIDVFFPSTASTLSARANEPTTSTI
ncbi:hypothetical protein BKA81DRAFT_40369 [Phyllosticta paracitricarpa]